MAASEKLKKDEVAASAIQECSKKISNDWGRQVTGSLAKEAWLN